MNDTTLCVDGGINNSTIKLIDSDEIISGSYVLKNKDPIAAMLLLKFIKMKKIKLKQDIINEYFS